MDITFHSVIGLYLFHQFQLDLGLSENSVPPNPLDIIIIFPLFK